MERISTTLEATLLAEAEGLSGSSSNVIWVCRAPSMRNLDEQVFHLARAQHPVLLTGETGTGKTTVARIIHQRSPRSSARFVDVNCAALPEQLLESELFGFERGAFTGAIAAKKGLFEVADKGTLFLDEVGELKPELQAKLLKAIDARKIRRLGGISDIDCNVRLMAASSRNLQRMIADGSFREDLYYRLAVLQLDVPPLRERQQEICELVCTQLTLEQAKLGRTEGFELDDRALKELSQYSWPGNIRQLQNVIARLACYADSNTISLDAVRAELARFKHLDSDTITLPGSCSTLFARESFHDFSRRVRGAVIDAAKRRHNGNMSRVARRLKLDRTSLLRIAQRIGAHGQSPVDKACRCPARTPGSHSPTQ